MKALLALGWYFPDSVGGTEVYVQGLAHRLRTRGLDVEIAAPEPNARALRTYEHEGLSVFRYPVPESPSRDEAAGATAVRGAEHLHAYLRELEPDVFHVHTIRTGLGIPELDAARKAGSRTVWTNHLPSLGWLCQRGTLMRWGKEACDGICKPIKCAACALHHRGLPKWAAQALALVSRATGGTMHVLPGRAGTAMSMTRTIQDNLRRQGELVKRVDRLLVLNELARTIALEHGTPPDKVQVCRLGVSLPDLVPKPGVDEAPTTLPIRVGFVARLHPVKGADVLLDALLGLPANAPIELEYCGPFHPGPEAEHVAALRARAGADPRIRFRDPVPGADVPALLRSYDVLCCPSTWFENGPTVALEARAVGTPVIGTRIGNPIELIRDDVDGALVAPGDVDALSGLLARLMEDPATIDRWRGALPATRTMDDIADDTLRVYEEVTRS